MARRVVVTGTGMISPLGNSVKESWEGIQASRSAAGYITHFDTSKYRVKIAAEVKNFDPLNHMSAKEANRSDPYQQYIIAAAREAIAEASFEVAESERHRVSVIIGSAVGGLTSFWETFSIIQEVDNPRKKVSAYGVPMFIVNGGSDMVSIDIGACGPSSTVVSACATGADCIGYAYDLIRYGRIEKALAGASEYPIMPIGLACFDRLGAIAHNNGNPEKAIRPFDKNRSGMIFGEGAGVMVLEELEYAKKRGANILAELVGYGSTVDAYHITAPNPSGVGGAAAITQAIEDARVNPEDIDYINAHGTGTELNDPMETRAIKLALGEHAYNIPISSTKSMTGHAMGATAALEAIFSVLSIRDRFAPATINYETPDPECDLDYVPNEPREVKITHVMSNSFGFGGHNASLIFKKFDD